MNWMLGLGLRAEEAALEGKDIPVRSPDCALVTVRSASTHGDAMS